MVKGDQLAESEDKKSQTSSAAETETKVEELTELSLEELDQVLGKEDPDFVASLGEVAKGPFDSEFLDDSQFKYTFEIEKKAWAQKKGAAAKVYKFFPLIVLFSYLFFVGRDFSRSKFQYLKIKGIIFVKEVIPQAKKKSKQFLVNGKGFLSGIQSDFQKRSRSGKIIFISLILGSMVGGVLSVRILMSGFFPPAQPLFLTSLNPYATEVLSFDPATEIESFYDSTRALQNVFALNRIIVNIKTSSQSGENPMAAFEFIVEGSSTDAVIEVKDREAEIRDRFQRVIEEMTFDHLASSEGKKALTDTLRRSTNQILSRGKLRRVFIKTAIVKP